MISKSFFENLELVAEEKGLSIEDVLAKVEMAMAVACRDTEHDGDIKLDIDFERKRIRVYEYHYVVEEITEGSKGEITVERAKELKPRSKPTVGTVIREEIDFTKLGRKSVSKFKNTFNNELKNLEREEAYNFFSEKVKEIITAEVHDANASFITFAIGKGIFASMPIAEAIPGETFVPGEQKKVYINKVEQEVFELSKRRTVDSFKPVTEVYKSVMESIEINAKRTDEVIGLDTGFRELNKY